MLYEKEEEEKGRGEERKKEEEQNRSTGNNFCNNLTTNRAELVKSVQTKRDYRVSKNYREKLYRNLASHSRF